MTDERRKKTPTQEAIDRAIKEWLDEKYAAFGRWTFWGIAAFVFSFVAKGVLSLSADDLKHILVAYQTNH